jgi:hypothetical protein
LLLCNIGLVTLAALQEQRTQAQEKVVKPTPLPMFLPQQKPVNYQRYVDLDRKVLRFYACWDDSASELGDKLPYIIHYYLTDNSIEVLSSSACHWRCASSMVKPRFLC